MSIVNKIGDAYVAAMKAKDTERRDTLKLVKAAFNTLDTAGGAAPTEADYINAVVKMAKKLREQASEFPGLADQYNAEASVIEEFVPQTLSPYEVTEMLLEFKREGDVDFVKRNMGTIVKTIVARSAGATDGKTVSDLVKSMIV